MPEKIVNFNRVPVLARVGNALVSYVIYLRQMVFPAGLAVPYPFPRDGLPAWEVCGGSARAGRGFGLRGGVPEKAPLSPDGLALVSGDAGSSDWNCSDILLRPCRPLHLSAGNRLGRGGDLGRGGLERGLETSEARSGRFDVGGGWRIESLRLHPDFVLERQQNAVDTRAGLHLRQQCRPQ